MTSWSLSILPIFCFITKQMSHKQQQMCLVTRVRKSHYDDKFVNLLILQSCTMPLVSKFADDMLFISAIA